MPGGLRAGERGHRYKAWAPNGGDNQTWELDRDGPGRRWWLRNMPSTDCMSVSASNGGSRWFTSSSCRQHHDKNS
ncbi:RICIN domain-containing protein [Nonomuraea sp. NPDC004186]